MKLTQTDFILYYFISFYYRLFHREMIPFVKVTVLYIYIYCNVEKPHNFVKAVEGCIVRALQESLGKSCPSMNS